MLHVGLGSKTSAGNLNKNAETPCASAQSLEGDLAQMLGQQMLG